VTSLQALRAEALELIAAGHAKIAEGNVILARLEMSTPSPASNGRGLPDLISLEAALELIPTPMRRETLMRQVGGMSWVRRPSKRKVVFERVGFTRWLASR